MSEIRSLDTIAAEDLSMVGGKALSLGLMITAGLPVPPGFCVTTEAHRRLNGRPLAEDAGLHADVLAAYQRLGGGSVAVRSSATAEDGRVASFAGQQETFL